MSKIILLGDVHFDCRSSSVNFLEYQRKFYENQFIPYCVKNNITTIIQLGDLFDKRQSINFRSLYQAKAMFFDLLQKHGITLHVFVGNHDLFYLESLEIDSPSLLLTEYDNIIIHKKPNTISIDSVQFDLIPWVCKENYEEVMKFVHGSHSDYCLGHFGFAGFAMYRGMISEEGFETTPFKKYKRVWSGHYHTRSQSGNIEYIGTPTEFNWQDCDDPRGFTVFDTQTLEQEFIQNDYTMFTKIEYNEDVFDYDSFNYESLKEKYVKVIVVNKANAARYDAFLQKVYESKCHDVTIVENFQNFTEGEVEEDIELEDTIEVVNSYIDSIDVNADKDKLKLMMQSLYIKAINGENIV